GDKAFVNARAAWRFTEPLGSVNQTGEAATNTGKPVEHEEPSHESAPPTGDDDDDTNEEFHDAPSSPLERYERNEGTEPEATTVAGHESADATDAAAADDTAPEMDDAMETADDAARPMKDPTHGVSQNAEVASLEMQDAGQPSDDVTNLNENAQDDMDADSRAEIRVKKKATVTPKRAWRWPTLRSGDDSAEGMKTRSRKKQKTAHVGPEVLECGCHKGFPESLLKPLKKGFLFPERELVIAIKKWQNQVFAQGYALCYKHTRLMVGALGMRNKSGRHDYLGHDELTDRLCTFYRHAIDKGIGEMKTDTVTFQMFKKKCRPAHSWDSLGPYAYSPEEDAFFTVTFSEEDQKNLQVWLGVDMEAWEKDGSVNVGIFNWIRLAKYPGTDRRLAGKTLHDAMLEEFDLYKHHLREINGRNNYGWCRNMFHSLTQQLFRQDPIYYCLYAALRPDRKTSLVSYPYYTKYQEPGDSTFFRHIDINIPELVEQKRGAFQIQGSVSLDDETEDDCTEILPGMHKKLAEWWPRLRERGLNKESFVHAITDEYFTKDDKADFGTDWKPVPCWALEARITQPHLPHGAKGPAKHVRRTVLPWFVGLQDDHRNLEVPEAGTYEDLRNAHADLVAGPFTPSGLINKYGSIPYRFGPAIPLAGLGALSDALVCRVRFDMPTVKKEQEVLFRGQGEERGRFVAKWRAQAAAKFFQCYLEVRDLEEELFGENSFAEALKTGEVVEHEGEDGVTFEGGHGQEGIWKAVEETEESSDTGVEELPSDPEIG
ncbi:hypothetical protein DV736_g6690, partial [Chaetothyriales sp. CBS 134916]